MLSGPTIWRKFLPLESMDSATSLSMFSVCSMIMSNSSWSLRVAPALDCSLSINDWDKIVLFWSGSLSSSESSLAAASIVTCFSSWLGSCGRDYCSGVFCLCNGLSLSSSYSWLIVFTCSSIWSLCAYSYSLSSIISASLVSICLSRVDTWACICCTESFNWLVSFCLFLISSCNYLCYFLSSSNSFDNSPCSLANWLLSLAISPLASPTSFWKALFSFSAALS